MDVKRNTRVRWALASWLFVLSAVAFLDRTNVSIAGLQISKEYALGNQRLGWMASAFLIAYAAFQVPAGWVSARYGPRRVLAFGVLWWGVATALTALLPASVSHAAMILVALRFGLGVGESVMYPAANQFVMRWFPAEERGLVNGLIFAGVGAGSGLTPPLLTWFILHHGWRSAFWLSAATGLVAGAIWWWIARDRPEEHPWVQTSELRLIRGIANADAATPALQAAPKTVPWKLILGRTDLLAMMAAYFGFLYVAWIYFSWFFIYMAQVRGFDMKASARYTMLPFLSMTVFCLAGGKLNDVLARKYGVRAGRCGLAAGASLLTAVFLILGSQTHSPQLAGYILALGAGALYLSQSSYWAASIDIAGPSSGIFSSMVNMGGQIGGAVTASLTPWIAQRFGWTTSFATAAAFAVLSAILWLTVHPERPLAGEASEPAEGVQRVPGRLKAAAQSA
ncbi:sugar phosphate permease [Terriglobus roseus DSM 18391]|uniref:Sugar phosphate permease n=1 Tax=Terriglobus roseus (strain DSM 18391 / NRRL B-41598 / KBS 63) TaxID=926566 RepID=I3ZFP7_TERRK|nr:MFS transporter [Terriglobus roseus]AFL88065.1 sugar phosphate permease [Terriglobus roseus DSM 18391]